MRLLRGVTLNALLVVIVAIDVILVAAVVRHMDGRSASFQAAAASVPSVDPVASTPTTPTSPTPAAAKGLHRLLSFSSTDDGWRAIAGCNGPARLQRTTDGGRTWKRLAAPAAHVLRLTMTSSTAGWLIGASSGCSPTFFTTSDGGRTWTAGTGLGQAWVVLKQRLRLPTSAIVQPCGVGVPVGAVAPASVTVALVQCGSELMRTTDGGTTWATVGPFSHGGHAVAAALVPGTSQRGVALLVGAGGCAGLAVARTTDAGARWLAGPCLARFRPPAALSLAPDDSGYVLAGQLSARTVDAGASWA